jgi:hypothetical protein
MRPNVNLKLKRAGKSLLLGAFLVCAWTGTYAAYLVAEHNFHVVTAEQVYRSSRMSPATLTATMEQHGIKSVLSLIGPSLAESNTVQRLGGSYFDVSLSDRHEVTDAQMEKIIAVLRTAPKPVLIHCKAGADRTGLAAALYHYAIEGEPAAVADDELTLRYGHLPAWLGFGTSAMDRSYWRYVGAHASQTNVSAPLVYSGALDGSAAVVIDSNLFANASDEDSTIRLYHRERGGEPVQTIDLSSFLEVDPHSPETDIEAGARMGNRAYWITSHGRNKNGKERVSRQRFFATDIITNEHGIQILPAGKPYKDLLEDLTGAEQLKQFDFAAAAARAPKSPGGLAIEGLAATPDGRLLIGFRNPVPEGRALLVPLLNPDEVIDGKHAQFGEPIQMDLDGLGIRDISSWQGEFIIIAGRYDAGGKSKIFRWAGGNSVPKPMKQVSLKGLNAEAILIYPDRELREFQLLSDDSTEQKISNDATATRSGKHFRSVWITP